MLATDEVWLFLTEFWLIEEAIFMRKEVAISTVQLMQQYRSHAKNEGVAAALKQLFARDISKRTALFPLNLEIPRGQIIGLVGSNGAGKTTLLKLLSGLIHPTQGTASVLGHTPWKRDHDFLRRISLLLGQKNQLWWDIPAIDSFRLLTTIYDLDRTKASLRIHDLAERLHCAHVLNTPLRRLSLGERMKMELIGCLLHSPEVLFLDEPTIGLDVVAQNSMRQFILEEHQAREMTIILTSHYMDDIAALTQRLLLISHGKMVYDGSVKDFIGRTAHKKRLVVELNEPLQKELVLASGAVIPKESLVFEASVSTTDLLDILKAITPLPQLHDIKIEEPDFEEVICEFIEQESSLHQTRDHQ